LRGIAHAAIDVSDGLLGDLGHVLSRSRLGAVIHATQLPLGPVLAQQPADWQKDYALNGGDDYELCFTATPAQRDAVLSASQFTNTPVTRVGNLIPDSGLQVLDAAGKPLSFTTRSFDHFSEGI
jgi:thiamine-monophosphate kinase